MLPLAPDVIKSAAAKRIADEGHMNDRTLFILLLAIALGVWANLLLPRVAPAQAQESRGYTLQSLYSKLLAIQGDLAELKRQVGDVKNGITEIKTGTCRNPKIC
jgi:hypothetical protein